MLRRVLVSLVALSLVAAGAAVAAVGQAGASTLRYSHVWSPPLNLASNYRPCCTSAAGFTTLPFTMNVTGSQEAVLTVVMHTNWVDTKARTYTPNIIQQGRYVKPIEIKISIHSGRAPADHRAQCRIEGAGGGVVNAQGPKGLDVADGFWHTITCIKFPDGAGGTAVRVVVDGIAGPVFHSRVPIGNVISTAPVDLGGQGPVANKDSIDGQYLSVSYTVS
jgi:hypothetical protein